MAAWMSQSFRLSPDESHDATIAMLVLRTGLPWEYFDQLPMDRLASLIAHIRVEKMMSERK
jgi:hypothetical protein